MKLNVDLLQDLFSIDSLRWTEIRMKSSKWPTLTESVISCVFWGRVTPTCCIICPDVLTCKWIVYNSWDRGALHDQAVEGIDDTFLSQGLSLDLLVNRLHNYIGFSYWQRPASHDNKMGGKAFFFFHSFLHLPQSPRTLWQNHLWGKQTWSQQWNCPQHQLCPENSFLYLLFNPWSINYVILSLP